MLYMKYVSDTSMPVSLTEKHHIHMKYVIYKLSSLLGYMYIIVYNF